MNDDGGGVSLARRESGLSPKVSRVMLSVPVRCPLRCRCVDFASCTSARWVSSSSNATPDGSASRQPATSFFPASATPSNSSRAPCTRLGAWAGERRPSALASTSTSRTTLARGELSKRTPRRSSVAPRPDHGGLLAGAVDCCRLRSLRAGRRRGRSRRRLVAQHSSSRPLSDRTARPGCDPIAGFESDRPRRTVRGCGCWSGSRPSLTWALRWLRRAPAGAGSR